jgi:hypothetical protein
LGSAIIAMHRIEVKTKIGCEKLVNLKISEYNFRIIVSSLSHLIFRNAMHSSVIKIIIQREDGIEKNLVIKFLIDSYLEIGKSEEHLIFEDFDKINVLAQEHKGSIRVKNNRDLTQKACKQGVGIELRINMLDEKYHIEEIDNESEKKDRILH